MAKKIIMRRRKPSRKKDAEPGLLERLKKLTDDAPVAKVRDGRFVLDKNPDQFEQNKYKGK